MALAHSQADLQQAYIDKGKNYQPRTKHWQNGRAKFVNHLILSNSPYLLQHAHNPVNWYSFGDEAFKLAQNQNKLILLSIGYATCHWCHVMEEESFEDLEVAKVLNDNYIAIKVDREVNPDIDNHFMNISQLLNGSGGWPLNVVLTPNGDGFYAGTYFRKEQLINVLNQLNNLWRTNNKAIFKQAENVKNALHSQQQSATIIDKNIQNIATQNLLRDFDEFYGGFGSAPKFPHEMALLMLIDEDMKNATDDQLLAITTTLDEMASGGIYDVVGGGFHRYSTDERWLVPHFEKMLYNQAQLAIVYAKAYQLTGKNLYHRITQQILDYVIRELKIKNGFMSATDADSEGEEGLFFTWDIGELTKILGKDLKVFDKYFDLSDSTKFEGRNIIRYKDINTLTNDDFAIIDKLLAKLYAVRNKRIAPLTDNKILLSWNALLLQAFVIANDIDKKYGKEALWLAQTLDHNFARKDLLRVMIDGNVSEAAIFEDYAYLANAYLSVFDLTADKKWLIKAQNLMQTATDKFWDKRGGFNISNNPRIDFTQKEIYDGAIPSSNGVAYQVLNKLFSILGDKKYQIQAQQLLEAFSSQITKNPSAYPSIVKGISDKNYGVINNIVYLYNGKIKLQIINNKITIKLQKGWHINANKVFQDNLIATKLTGKNLVKANYPKPIFMNLGFSKEKLAVYEGEIMIDIKLKNNDFSIYELTMQACSDQVCLPPITVNLGF